MRPSVRAAFLAFNRPFEGRLPFMYLDVRGLVTTGVGNLIDPIQLAFPLPWERPDGTMAGRVEVAGEWQHVKTLQSLAKAGGAHFEAVTRLRLSQAAIDALVLGKLAEIDRALCRRFADYEGAPADAQLGILSMAYAMGEHRLDEFPLFCVAVRAGDWTAAAAECHMRDEDNRGVIPRNAANRLLFANAAQVSRLELELDPDVLHYPEDLSAECPPAA